MLTVIYEILLSSPLWHLNLVMNLMAVDASLETLALFFISLCLLCSISRTELQCSALFPNSFLLIEYRTTLVSLLHLLNLSEEEK